MSASRTPGPWTWGYQHDGTLFISSRMGSDVSKVWIATINTTGKLAQEQSVGNAKLMAAAPRMLDALTAVRERCAGIFVTDQETGQTFDKMIDAALREALK